MLRNPISFIFKLGKHQSLRLRPLRQLSVQSENPASLNSTSLITPEAPLKIQQTPHSNQMPW